MRVSRPVRGWVRAQVRRRLGDPLLGKAQRVGAVALRRLWGWASFAAAVGPGDAEARRFVHFGEGSLLAFPPGVVYNERYIHVGEGTVIGPYVSLTVGMAPGQEMLSSPVVRIGDRCVIGRGSHVVGHWSVEIGDDVQTGPYVYITDQNHSYADPDEPIGRQWPVEAGVTIGEGSWLGAHVVVLPGAQIGRHVVVGAGAVVRGAVPDHCVVAGVPARVVRRWSPEHGWVDADGAPTPAMSPGAEPGSSPPGPSPPGPGAAGPVSVALIGPGECDEATESRAEEVGRLVAGRGAVLVCGGLGGVMAAGCRGARSAGGTTVGLLPGTSRADANPWVSVAVPTGLGELRNGLVVRAADVVLALGAGFGTLSEIGFALKLGRPVVGLRTWGLLRPGGDPDRSVHLAEDPVEAVALALALALAFPLGSGSPSGGVPTP